jgi:choline dehydrogenase
MGTWFDYVVVGGGTSGCLAAAKLVSTYNARVLLLEAGADRWTSAFTDACWLYQNAQGKQLFNFPRINSPIPVVRANANRATGERLGRRQFCRGRAADWNAWPALTGSDLWNWNAILPHFLAQEGNAKFKNEFHGSDGPMLVSDPGYICEMSQI